VGTILDEFDMKPAIGGTTFFPQTDLLARSFESLTGKYGTIVPVAAFQQRDDSMARRRAGFRFQNQCSLDGA
jgi:hypothetical protein